MSRLFSYLRPMRGRLSASVGFSVVNKVFDLAPPILVAWLIDSVTGNAPAWMSGFGLTEMFPQIVFVAILTVLIFGVESLSQWGYAYGFMTIAQDAQHRLRVDAYSRMQSREIRFFEEQRLGQTLAMLNDDVNQLERFSTTPSTKSYSFACWCCLPAPCCSASVRALRPWACYRCLSSSWVA